MRNPKFDALLRRMGEIHDKKNHDYAQAENPYSNFEIAAQFARGFDGADAVFATLIGVKIARLQELLGAGKTPNNEGIEDTLLDMAVYAALWASYRGVGYGAKTQTLPIEDTNRRAGKGAPLLAGELSTVGR